jgi:hypothetical protein
MKIFLLFFAVFLFINSATSQIPPTVEWKNVTYRDKDIYNNPVTRALSGDEWWYSHKNLYDNTNTQIGYVAAGYIAEIVHPGDEAQMRNVFN